MLLLCKVLGLVSFMLTNKGMHSYNGNMKPQIMLSSVYDLISFSLFMLKVNYSLSSIDLLAIAWWNSVRTDDGISASVAGFCYIDQPHLDGICDYGWTSGG